MNKKIAIIGGGLFGSTIYITLKRKGFDCTLFERNNDLLLGVVGEFNDNLRELENITGYCIQLSRAWRGQRSTYVWRPL